MFSKWNHIYKVSWVGNVWLNTSENMLSHTAASFFAWNNFLEQHQKSNLAQLLGLIEMQCTTFKPEKQISIKLELDRLFPMNLNKSEKWKWYICTNSNTHCNCRKKYKWRHFERFQIFCYRGLIYESIFIAWWVFLTS